jgi:low temperature requirement protein LtrA
MTVAHETNSHQHSTGLFRPMVPRASDEAHRAATPLELFFDLVIVVAVARAAAFLHHGIADDHIVQALVAYVIAFYAYWLTWLNFSWFASAYDNDDVPYRLTVFVMMIGALVIAAGIEGIVVRGDFTLGVLGYIVMRLAMVVLWLRAGLDDPPRRPVALRYAVGIFSVQILWVAFLFVPVEYRLAFVVVLALLELAVPYIAERKGTTSWHPHHIAERYGLFTIIVLGESILAAVVALEESLVGGTPFSEVATIVTGGLATVFSMWWLYFLWPSAHILQKHAKHFRFGYAHYFIFGSAAAVGAGIGVTIDQATHQSAITNLQASLAFAIPVAIYLLALWYLLELPVATRTADRVVTPMFVVGVITSAWLPATMLVTGVLLVALVVTKLWMRPDLRIPEDD